MQKKWVLIPVLLCAVAGVLFVKTKPAVAKAQEEIPFRTTGSGISDAAQVGNVADAMVRARKLMTFLLAHGGVFPTRASMEEIELSDLPDTKYAEDPDLRKYPHSGFVRWSSGSKIPKEAEGIVFYSEVYARKNRAYYKGDRSKANPTGFFIVGYSNGDIKQVPVEQIRSPRTGNLAYCFPGQACYADSVPNPFYSKDSAVH